MSTAERRTQPRILLRFPVGVSLHEEGVGRPFEGEVLNLSLGGIFLATKAPYAEGARIELDLIALGLDCKAKGKLLWRGNLGGGAEFDDVSESFDTLVARLNAMSPKELADAGSSITNAHVLIRNSPSE